MCALLPILFPYREVRRGRALACKIERADFTNWMSFLQFNLVEEINLNTKALSTNT